MNYLTNEPFNQSPTQLFYCSNAQLSAFAPLHLSRALYKSTLFMQNKPNLPDAQMNVTLTITKHYENARLRGREKNKPKTNPNKPNLSRRSLWRSRIKPNFNPTASGPASTFCCGMLYPENYVL